MARYCSHRMLAISMVSCALAAIGRIEIANARLNGRNVMVALLVLCPNGALFRISSRHGCPGRLASGPISQVAAKSRHFVVFGTIESHGFPNARAMPVQQLAASGVVTVSSAGRGAHIACNPYGICWAACN